VLYCTVLISGVLFCAVLCCAASFQCRKAVWLPSATTSAQISAEACTTCEAPTQARKHLDLHCSAGLYCTVLYCTVQYSTIRYSVVASFKACVFPYLAPQVLF